MCPESIEICLIGNYSSLIEALFASLAVGLTLGFVVGLVIFTINKKG